MVGAIGDVMSIRFFGTQPATDLVLVLRRCSVRRTLREKGVSQQAPDAARADMPSPVPTVTTPGKSENETP